MPAGRPPKPPGEKIRRNIDTVPTQHLEVDGQIHGPELPESHSWHPQTLLWWNTWRTSPQASTFTPTDWDFLLDTALLHSKHWNGENVAAELRLRVAKFGATPEDRQHLRFQIGDPEKPKVEESKPITPARQTRLLKLVGANDTKETKVV